MGRMPDDDFSELLETCTQFVSWHGPIRADRLLATVPPDTVVDRYGEGGVVADLERETAGLLGKPAAVFLPSGTMAQQAVLREWRQRHGGTLFGLWPNAASARTCLAQRLPRMPEYLRHAQAIADAIRGLPGVRVIPDPPQTSMMHLLLPTTQEGFGSTARRLAKDQGIWTWPRAAATPDPAVQRVELSVGDATCALKPGQVREIISAFAAR